MRRRFRILPANLRGTAFLRRTVILRGTHKPAAIVASRAPSPPEGCDTKYRHPLLILKWSFLIHYFRVVPGRKPSWARAHAGGYRGDSDDGGGP